MEGVFHRMALVALMGCVACAAAPPAPQPVVPSKARSAPVPSPAVTSSFAARAPEHTRLLLAMDLNAMIDHSKLRALSLLMAECKLDLAHDVERIEVAVSEPAEIRIDLSGTLSVATAQCVLDALTERGLLPAGAVRVAPLAHGVRLATERAFVDGPAASSDLTRSFDALASRSKNVLVSDLAPGGKYELWSDGAGAITLRTALHSAEQALAAAEWTERALASEPTAELRDIEAKAEGAALTLFLPNPSERRALLLRQHVIEAFRIPSGSMLPTLLPGDHLFVVKGPSAPAPQRGDIVVFRSPREPSMDYVKRVIGVAGDHIELDGYRVRVNGQELLATLDEANYVPPLADAPRGELWREKLGDHEYLTLRDPTHPWGEALDVTLGPDSVFLLGDNRDNSMDSRHFGSVACSSIKGRLALVWASFGQSGPDWERFGLVPR